MAVVTLKGSSDYRFGGKLFLNGVRETVDDSVADELEATGYFDVSVARAAPAKKGGVTIKNKAEADEPAVEI